MTPLDTLTALSALADARADRLRVMYELLDTDLPAVALPPDAARSLHALFAEWAAAQAEAIDLYLRCARLRLWGSIPVTAAAPLAHPLSSASAAAVCRDGEAPTSSIAQIGEMGALSLRGNQ